MRLFICEYVTGGGLLGSPLPPGLAREGDMMLGALVKDVAALGGIDILTTRDARLGDVDLPAECRTVNGRETPWRLWQEMAERSDAVWPIAPETDGALLRLSALVGAAGRTLVGSKPEAVCLAGSKRATTDRLIACGVATVPTVRADPSEVNLLPPVNDGWVLKPDDGAGAESTRLFRRRDDLLRAMCALPRENNMVVQPYIPGVAASLSVLCRKGRTRLLSCNQQDIVIDDDRFRYRGGVVGALEARRSVYEAIANSVVAAIPGLWGHVGIDLIDGASEPVVLEVNPRLTTSYVGLGRAIGVNPAGLALRLLASDMEAANYSWPVTPQRVDVAAGNA